MFLATVKQARAFVGRNAITFVISLSVTSCTFLYDSGQEPASWSEIDWWGVKNILFIFIFYIDR
jgi:hypothetical protein